MLTRLLSRLNRIRPTAPAARAKARPKALRLEALEAREVPAIAYALTADTNTLLRFDTATPGTVAATTQVTGLTAGDILQGIDFRPRTGQLIGSATSVAGGSQIFRTYVINPTSGAATLIGATATPVTNGSTSTFSGFDFNPTVDRIRYVGSDGTTNTANARLNPNTGALAANDTAVTPNSTVIIGAAYDRDTDRLNATNIPTTLYVIDRATGTLGTLGGVDGTPSPNLGAFTAIGSLGFTLSTTNDGGFDIVEATGPAAAANNNGRGVAYAALTASDGVTRLYTINLTTGAATAVGTLGAGATEIFSLAVVPEAVVVVGSGLGANGDVRLLDPATGANRLGTTIQPFVGFQGGVRVASGDVNGDGVPDAIVTAVEAANGHVKVFDGTTGAEIRSFFAFPGYTGSVNVAAGDVNGDGFADIIVVSNGAGSNVRVFSGRDATGATVLSSFLAYQGFNGNTTVTAADFNNDGVDEIVTAAAINGHTKVFTGNNNFAATLFAPAAADNLPNFVSSFFAFSPYLGDVSVAAGDVNGDGTPDIALASGRGVRLNVRVVNGATGAQLSSFFADNFGTTFTGGGTVGVSDFNRDGRYDLVVTPGVGTQATAVAIDPLTGTTLGSFSAFSNFQGGATVAGARF